MWRIWMVSIANHFWDRESSCSSYLHGQHFFRPGTIRPFQNQSKWKPSNLAVVSNPNLATIISRKSSCIKMPNAPEASQQWVCRPRCGWDFARDRLSNVFLRYKVWQKPARYVPRAHDDEKDQLPLMFKWNRKSVDRNPLRSNRFVSRMPLRERPKRVW